MTWWNIYIVLTMVAAGISLVTTASCRKLASLTGFVDRPQSQQHKGHQQETPLLGGLAMCLAWLIVIIGGMMASKLLTPGNRIPIIASQLSGMFSVSREMMFLALGAVMAMLLGLWDDRYNMSARAKLGGQIAVAAIAATWGGARLSIFLANPTISWLITMMWFLGVMNAINLFDNMDGLAVGTAAIAFSFFTLAAAIQGQHLVASLGAVCTGCTVGFWFFNHSPASIFMGDSGSHFLGYLLAVMGVMVTYYRENSEGTKFSILIPLFILAIPIFDVLAVIVIRIKKHKPIHIGDHNHISHRFVRMGMGRAQAVMMVHLLAICIGLSVLPLLWGDERTAVVSLIQACTILLLVSMLQYRGKKEHDGTSQRACLEDE